MKHYKGSQGENDDRLRLGNGIKTFIHIKLVGDMVPDTITHELDYLIEILLQASLVKVKWKQKQT